MGYFPIKFLRLIIMEINHKIAFWGWMPLCTEAILSIPEGVDWVEADLFASKGAESSFSEAVIVQFRSPEVHRPRRT